MRTLTPVYVCDVPDCRSTCTLAGIQEQNNMAELEKRGWAVVQAVTDDKAATHYCPGCRALGKIPA